MRRLLAGALGALMIAPATAGAAQLGVAQNAERGTEGAATAQRLRDLGATSIRVLIDWNAVEPNRGARSWSLYDDFFGQLRKHRIRPLLLVTNSPPWAQDPSDSCLFTTLCPPSAGSLPAFGHFVGDLVRRYTSGPHASNPVGLEVWNEENITTSWRTRNGPDPARYFELLRIASQASRAAAPQLPVVLGGVTSSIDDDFRNKVGMERFLTYLYARGARELFDVMAIHIYPHPQPGEDIPARNVDKVMQRLDVVLDQHGDGGKPIWVTEMGVADPEEVGGTHTQGSLLLSTFDRLARDPDVRRIYVFRLRRADGERGFGITDRDLRPRPSFELLRARFLPQFEAAVRATGLPEQTAAAKKKAKKKVKKVRCTKAQRRRDNRRPKSKRRCKLPPPRRAPAAKRV